MASIVFYYNKAAGSGRSPFREEELRKFFFRHELRFRYPESREELHDHLETDVQAKVDYIFSVGGDGTANTIAQKVLNCDTKLMVLPSGTANDFAREVGTSGNLKKIAQIFHAQQTRMVDVISVNGRAMISNGGIGIAGDVAAEVNRKRQDSALFKSLMREMGKETYGFLLLRHLLTRPLPLHRVMVESPDLPLPMGDVRTPLILVNNQQSLAGKCCVAPDTKNDDGTFNVTMFLHQSKHSFARAAAHILRTKQLPKDENIVSFETKELVLTPLTAPAPGFFGDGEQFAEAASYEIRVLPKAIRVCALEEETLFCSGYGLDQIQQLQ